MRRFLIDRDQRGRRRVDFRIFGRRTFLIEPRRILISWFRGFLAILLRGLFVRHGKHYRGAQRRERRNRNDSVKLSLKRERCAQRDGNLSERELPFGMGRTFLRNVHDLEHPLSGIEQSENRRTELPDRIFVLHFRTRNVQRLRRKRFVYVRLHPRLVRFVFSGGGKSRNRFGKRRRSFIR